MRGRILVVCASRDREIALARMVDSVKATSGMADVAVWIDDDQRERYTGAMGIGVYPGIAHGPRMGPVASLNRLVQMFPSYEAYGAATDDCEFLTPGWDQWILESSAKFPAKIGLMAPKVKGADRYPESRGIDRMDFPWATRRWIEVVGWFAFPSAYHFYWDIMSELIGEATAIKYATESEFLIDHDAMPTDDLNVKTVTDARNVLPAIALERPKIIAKLREAIARG